jgi:hypothetical protein
MKILLHDGRTFEGTVWADDGDVFDICWTERSIEFRATIPRSAVEMEWEGDDVTFHPSPKLRELQDAVSAQEPSV